MIADAKYNFEHHAGTKFQKVEIIERKDIGMTEVLTSAPPLPDGRVLHTAIYVPYGQQMTQMMDGQPIIEDIFCDERHDLYVSSNSGRCYGSIYINPDYILSFKVHQQLMSYIPAIHDHMLATLQQAKRKPKTSNGNISLQSKKLAFWWIMICSLGK